MAEQSAGRRIWQRIPILIAAVAVITALGAILVAYPAQYPLARLPLGGYPWTQLHYPAEQRNRDGQARANDPQ
jgi:hypothetical protein